MKSVAHFAVTAYLRVHHVLVDDGAWRAHERTDFAHALERAARSLERAPAGSDDRRLRATLIELVETTRALVGAFERAELDAAALERFAAATRPFHLGLLEAAGRWQLLALHAAVEDELPKIGRARRGVLRIVVAGNHQARRRSLPVQYFARRVRELPGEEPRVVYGENVSTEDEAVALLGAIRTDRILARALLGDPERMDRDLLGDGAAKILDEMDVRPLAAEER